MAYVYRHIRLDKNQPFYIGVGSMPRRSGDRSDRSVLWKNIVAKTKYEIEIIIDDISWEEALKKEKYFIGLYGRIDKKTGILANLTDGGDGAIGVVQSEETRKKRSISHAGKKAPWAILLAKDRIGIPLTESHKANLSKGQRGCKKTMTKKRVLADNRNSKSVSMYSMSGEFIATYISIREACRHIDKHHGYRGVKGACDGKFTHAYGFVWKYCK